MKSLFSLICLYLVSNSVIQAFEFVFYDVLEHCIHRLLKCYSFQLKTRCEIEFRGGAEIQEWLLKCDYVIQSNEQLDLVLNLKLMCHLKTVEFDSTGEIWIYVHQNGWNSCLISSESQNTSKKTQMKIEFLTYTCLAKVVLSHGVCDRLKWTWN
mmetsp:Transcript_766/g.1403  ORF Transcript_766/g.1403 Transcript_766/m.1403 type:complete len:154 (+) Transcript_766:1995-2456(+)